MHSFIEKFIEKTVTLEIEKISDSVKRKEFDDIFFKKSQLVFDNNTTLDEVYTELVAIVSSHSKTFLEFLYARVTINRNEPNTFYDLLWEVYYEIGEYVTCEKYLKKLVEPIVYADYHEKFDYLLSQGLIDIEGDAINKKINEVYE